jgi:hypothetical protein
MAKKGRVNPEIGDFISQIFRRKISFQEFIPNKWAVFTIDK